MEMDEFKGDNFTKWILGISAVVFVSIGVGMFERMGTLVDKVDAVDARSKLTQQSILHIKDQLSAFNYELERMATNMNDLSTRVTRLEVRMERDNTNAR